MDEYVYDFPIRAYCWDGKCWGGESDGGGDGDCDWEWGKEERRGILTVAVTATVTLISPKKKLLLLFEIFF